MSDVRMALAGEWNTPVRVAFVPGAEPGTVRSLAGELTLALAKETRDGKVLHLVTLTESSCGSTMIGQANLQCTRLRWDNGAVWAKVVKEAVPEQGRVAAEAKPSGGKEERPARPCCCGFLGGCSSWAGGCARQAGSASSSGPQPGQVLAVEVLSARGLQGTLTDIYCKCAILDKPGAISFRTPVLSSENPVWNHVGQLEDYEAGDSLEFTLWDKGSFGNKEPLGRAVLESARFHPDGFEGELRVEGAGEGVEAFLTIDAPPASQATGRRPMLSTWQVENVATRINELLDVPLVPESLEEVALKLAINVVNRRLRAALLTFCARGWVNSLDLLLDETLDRKTKSRATSEVLKGCLRDPLAKALTGLVGTILGAPDFIQGKLLQANELLVNQIVQELVEAAVDGLEDVGLSMSVSDAIVMEAA